MQKRYWLRGGIAGLVASIVIYLIVPAACSDFYRIGPIYPTDQPICYALVVNGRWFEILIIVLAFGLFVGWLYGKIKNRKQNLPSA